MTTATDSHERANWWSRPCGGREVLLLAVPLFVSTASWTIMNFIDRMFLVWYSEEAVAAVLPAGMVHFAMISLPLGIASYTNTFVAQYYGAGHRKRIGPAVWQGIYLGLVCIPLYLALIPLAPWIFAFHAPLLAHQEVLFFQIALFGAGAEIIAAAMAAFFTGRGVTWVVMLVDSSAWSLNILLDYGLIRGHFGLPSLGIEGAALATVVALWWRVAIYSILLGLPRFRRYNIRRGWRFDATIFRRLLRYGGPSGLQMLVEVAGFTLFLLVVGVLGEDALAATNLAFNVNCLAFVPMLGLGIALSTLVGQQLGRGNPQLAARATMTSLSMALGYMGTMALVYVLFPGLFLLGYAWGASPAEFQQLRGTTVILLRFVAAYCLFDALNVIFSGTLKGAGDTRFIMIVSLVLTPMPVAAAWIGIHYYHFGLIWCWIVITLWVCISGLIYLSRYLQGHWRRIRVIEPELVRGDEQ